VRAGESLWSVAAGHLGAGASDADVADAWPRWYRENVATIGPDPNLIHPGQLLQAPSEEIP
jgi:nucleoid-associated protein YgaU